MKFLSVLLLLISSTLVLAQEPAPKAKAKGKGKGKGKAKASAVPPRLMMPLTALFPAKDPAKHRDFPDLCVDEATGVWVTYIEHDGQADVLHLARREAAALKHQTAVSRPGVLHQPAIAADGASGVWCFWGQVNSKDVVTLRARRFTKGKLEDEVELAATPDAGNSFADAATDASGRVWVTWQEVRPGASRIWTRHYSPDSSKWGDPIRVSQAKSGGNWEPRLTFAEGKAWIVYDSSEGSEFNLRLASVTAEGQVQDRVLLATPEYEARASISAGR